MTIRRWWAAGLALTCAAGLARAQFPATAFAGAEGDQPPVVGAERPVKPAASRVTAVTVYQGNALVTRTVDVPEGKGLVEVVVTPLPAETIDSSLYTEGTDGLRVLSTRYRMRAVKEDTRPRSEPSSSRSTSSARRPSGSRRRPRSTSRTSSSSASWRTSPARPSSS